MDFHIRLKKTREERGLSLQQLADAVGVTKQALSRYEKNYIQPRIPVLAELARVLGVTTDYLCGVDED